WRSVCVRWNVRPCFGAAMHAAYERPIMSGAATPVGCSMVPHDVTSTSRLTTCSAVSASWWLHVVVTVWVGATAGSVVSHVFWWRSAFSNPFTDSGSRSCSLHFGGNFTGIAVSHAIAVAVGQPTRCWLHIGATSPVGSGRVPCTYWQVEPAAY